MKGDAGICVIGTGRAGMIHAMSFAGGIKGARLAAIADPDDETREKAGAALGVQKTYGNYMDALMEEEIKGVVVVSPTRFHHKIVIDALNMGKHVLCEKPMALTEAECDEMITAAHNNKCILQLGFMRRFDSSFRRAKEAVEQGAIGDLVSIKSLTRGPSTPKAWMMDVEKSNGPLAEVNSHDIDTLRWFSKSEISQVYAVADNYRFPEQRKCYPDFYDNVLMTVKFKNGMQGLVDGAQGAAYGYDARVEILGTEGIIFLGKNQEDSMVLCNKGGDARTLFTKSWKTLFNNAYREEDAHFADCINTGREPEATGVDGKMAVRAVRAGNLSIREKRVVEL